MHSCLISQLINTSPELSQRLFGLANVTLAQTAQNATTTHTTLLNALVKQQQQQQQQQQIKTQQQQQQNTTNELLQDPTHLHTELGLKVRNLQKQKQQQHCSNNSNSLLKQQLRSGLKEIVENNKMMKSQKSQQQQQQETSQEISANNEIACSALQSLANVAAERQPPTSVSLQPPSASDLQQQFLLHIAANPMLKSSSEFFQRQQKHQQQMLEQQQQQQQEIDDLEFINEQNEKSEPELMLIDESLGLEYKSPEHNENGNDGDGNVTNEQVGNNCSTLKPTSRSVQRRRVRRKAQSSVDDQAEHLTEMSVRGLDLFRYACVNEGVYQCTECAKENVQKTFKNKYSFQRHAFLYHEGQHRKVFPCPLCGKEFSRPDKMKNHMKMTHESFVSNKEVTNFNPLNYLITAAAAGEMHATLFTQQQHHQQQQQQSEQLDQLTVQQQQQQQYNNAMAALGVNLETKNIQSNALSVSLEPSNVQTNIENSSKHIQRTEQNTEGTISAMNISAAALLKLQNDVVIKREVEISPAPSPPPPPTIMNLPALSSQLSLTTSMSPTRNITIALPQTQQTANATTTPRVEEVK